MLKEFGRQWNPVVIYTWHDFLSEILWNLKSWDLFANTCKWHDITRWHLIGIFQLFAHYVIHFKAAWSFLGCALEKQRQPVHCVKWLSAAFLPQIISKQNLTKCYVWNSVYSFMNCYISTSTVHKTFNSDHLNWQGI